MNIAAYMILVAIDDLNVCNNGLTFLLIQHEHTETPMHEEIHDPNILTGSNGNDSTAPISVLLWLKRTVKHGKGVCSCLLSLVSCLLPPCYASLLNYYYTTAELIKIFYLLQLNLPSKEYKASLTHIHDTSTT